MDVEEMLYEARDKDDLETFGKLMKEHSELLYIEEEGPLKGHCKWLHTTARKGKLPFVKFLIEEMGVDVNNPQSTEIMPEGPIDTAAGNGRLEVVRYLLDKGAVINNVMTPEMRRNLAKGDESIPANMEFKPVVRCMPLTSAADGGHLEVVKLLVERGADLNASWNGMNALTFAYGEVKEYLESVGMKPVKKK